MYTRLHQMLSHGDIIYKREMFGTNISYDFLGITLEKREEKRQIYSLLEIDNMTIISPSVTLIKRWWRLSLILLTPLILLPLPLVVNTIVSINFCIILWLFEYLLASTMRLHCTSSYYLLGIRSNSLCSNFVVTTCFLSNGWYSTWWPSGLELLQSNYLLLLLFIHALLTISSLLLLGYYYHVCRQYDFGLCDGACLFASTISIISAQICWFINQMVCISVFLLDVEWIFWYFEQEYGWIDGSNGIFKHVDQQFSCCKHNDTGSNRPC